MIDTTKKKNIFDLLDHKDYKDYFVKIRNNDNIFYDVITNPHDSLESNYVKTLFNRMTKAKKPILPNNKSFLCQEVVPSLLSLKISTDILHSDKNIKSSIYDIKDLLNSSISKPVMDKYYQSRKITLNEILYPKLPNGKSTSKDLKLHLEKNKIDTFLIGDLLYRLNNIYSNVPEITQTPLYITITHMPEAFALLGYYGCDYNSCLAGSNYIYKYLLPTIDHTFVLLLSKEPIQESDLKKERLNNDIIGRAFGVLKPSYMFINNFYIRNFNKYNMLQYIIEFYRNNFSKDFYYKNCLTNNSSIFYSNDDGIVLEKNNSKNIKIDKSNYISIFNSRQKWISNLNNFVSYMVDLRVDREEEYF